MSGGSSFGPVPSRLVFLSDLQHMLVGDKVRFLGCVQDYSIATGTLTLTHHYPTNLPYPAAVKVDIEHVLETIKPSDVDIGECVNVTGYVTSVVKTRHGKRATHKDNERKRRVVTVQAVMLWSAGSVKIDQYEAALEERLRSDSLMTNKCSLT